MTEQSSQTYPAPDGGDGRHPPNADAGEAKERAWHEWMMVSVGLTCLVAVLAIIMSIVALGQGNTPGAVTVVAPAASRTPAAQAAAPAVKPEAVKLLVKADAEHGKLGPDGKWHDAFLPGDFTVHAGAKVTVTVYNYDGGPHTFTAPGLGINEMIPGGGGSLTAAPKEVSFTFTAPAKAGRYQWWCTVPCDPWAMTHDGYMRGYVTVKA